MSKQLAGTTPYIEQIYNRLVDEIADGRLRPGQRISQEHLAESFNVSRQPVSHAIQLLKRQSLIRDFGRKGIEITPIDMGHIKSLYQVRMTIERLAVRLAAQRIADKSMPESLCQAARNALDAGMALLSVEDFEHPSERLVQLIHADVAFHTAIYRMSGNSSIEDILIPQWFHFRRAMVSVLRSDGAKQLAWKVHGEILDAIFTGDPDVAEATIIRHGDDTVASLDGQLD